MGFEKIVTTSRREVKVEREVECVDDANVYVVDTFTDDGLVNNLLWDVDMECMAIGFGFYDYYRDDETRTEYRMYRHVDPMPDKRTAFRAWLNLTEED